MGKVGHGTGVGANGHPQFPLSACIARLLIQFALGGLHRVFTLLTHSGTKLVACLLQSVTVLAHHDELALLGQGYHVHPIGIFQHIVFGNLGTGGQFHMVASGSQPGPFYDVAAVYGLPFAVGSIVR